MEILNLNLLWFLPLAAVPIVLHLLTLHRLKTVELSTFRFLFDSYVQQRRRMRFLDALLAFLRFLCLLLLILALARPVVSHWDALFGSGSGREVVLLVDGSASMNAVSDGVTSIERARSAAGTVLERLDANDRVTLVRVASRPDELASRFTSGHDGVREQIDAIQAGPSRANLWATFSHLFGPDRTPLSNPHIYLFTDMQAGSWRELEQQPLSSMFPEGVRLTVVNVGGGRDELRNRAVVGDPPDQHYLVAGLPILLRPRVTNSTPQTADIAVSIFIEEREIAQQVLTVPPGESATTEVVFTPREPGVLRGRYEIPADTFAADDAFRFTLTVEPQVRIVLVNGNPAADPLENEALYLRTALGSIAEHDETPSPGSPGAARSPEQQADSAFARTLDVHEIPEGQLNADVLREASLVILANCGGLNGQHFGWLRDFVSAGGGLIVFPGDKVNHDVYNQQFFPVPNTPDRALIAARLAAAEGDPNSAATFERLGAIDFAHPVLSVFDDPESRYLTHVSFYRRFPIELEKDRGAGWPLAEYTDGRTALLEGRFGDGRVLLAGFPATSKWTNLPLKPEFVPLVLRMVSHVRRRAGVEGPSVVPAEQIAEFAVPLEWSPAGGKVVDAGNRTTPLTLQRAASRLVGAFDRTTETGYYAVEVSGGRSEVAQRAETAFAVNLDPAESNFERASEPQLREMLPDIDITLVDASAEAQQLHGSLGRQREVWRPLILVLFVIIGIEFLLSTLGGPRTEAGPPKPFRMRLREIGTGGWIGRMTGAGAHESEREHP